MSKQGLSECTYEEGVCECDLTKKHLFRNHMNIAVECIDCGRVESYEEALLL